MQEEEQPPLSAGPLRSASSASPPVHARQQRQQRLQSLLIRMRLHILKTLLLLCFILLVTHLTVQDYYVDGLSMEPTLHTQEYILVNKAAYLFTAPARGDIIVFHYPKDPTQTYLKRIIAIPGDQISIIGRRVIVNGTLLQERYIAPADNYNLYPPIHNDKLGSGQYFVMGDDRVNSSDSRAWGPVPRQNIIGEAQLVYWPFNDIRAPE
ncbi:S26 family signal peptidase [Ktedonobacteria bacterium brp13]|nr:S26 family signal peptidase [Ktedonobacteria bacterium brp13]